VSEITETTWGIVVAIVIFCALAIVVLTIKSRNAQPSLVVTGVVKDAETGQPIASAEVSDDGYGAEPYKSTVTDSSGKYRYTTWAQEHTIVAEAPGYRTQRQILTKGFLRSEKEQILNFALVRK